MSDKFKLFARLFGVILSYSFKLLHQRIQAVLHKLTYKPLDPAKNVVVVGGSFAGFQLAKRLTETLPTGYKVVLIEKNSHLNYSFNFPRYSVLQGSEYKAFIPYDGIAKGAPIGIYQHVRDTATRITQDQIELLSGQKINYSYLAIATGSTQALPAKVSATGLEEACSELRKVQKNVENAQTIAIVGGGAVGIELAADIKSFYPEKDVTLIHSRDQLLPHFGRRLHEYVMNELEKLGIRVILKERPHISENAAKHGQHTLRFADHEESFDLCIPCTGQRANSSFLVDFAPRSVSKETNQIIVEPTLQVSDPTCQHVFAFGDVADTGGPKMARAAWFQTDIVLENILALINNRTPSKTYTPMRLIEGSIKLTLGKTHWVAYSIDDKGIDYMFSGDDGKPDLEVERAWKMYGGNIKAATLNANR